MKKYKTLSIIADVLVVILAVAIIIINRMENVSVNILYFAIPFLLLACLSAFFQWKSRKSGEEKNILEEETEDLPERDCDDTPALLVEGFPNDRLYYVESTQMYYAFVHIGHAELTVKDDLIPEKKLTDGDRLHAAAKDIWLAKSEIAEIKLKMKRCISTQLPSCASLKFKMNDGKKYSYIVVFQQLTEADIRTFFADVERKIR